LRGRQRLRELNHSPRNIFQSVPGEIVPDTFYFPTLQICSGRGMIPFLQPEGWWDFMNSCCQRHSGSSPISSYKGERPNSHGWILTGESYVMHGILSGSLAPGACIDIEFFFEWGNPVTMYSMNQPPRNTYSAKTSKWRENSEAFFHGCLPQILIETHKPGPRSRLLGPKQSGRKLQGICGP
jgi:hypothetical protein